MDASHVFFINGFLCQIKNDEKLMYCACPVENCKRKVNEVSPGAFRCEACDKTFPNFVPTYMITAKIADFTDSIYINFAREHGTAIMGMSP